MAERQDNDGIDPQERPEPGVPNEDTGGADADLDDLDSLGYLQVEPEGEDEEESDPGLPQVVTRRHDGKRVDVDADIESGSESSLAAAVVSSISDDDPLIGHRFGGFEITERIGHGGMGTVYKGQQVSLDREVAIKILNTQLVDNQEFIRRFQREAKSIARISHPNIVAVHDFGESDGHYYMVIEYVKGTNLSRMIAERLVLTPEEFIPILLQSLDGLEHVAKSGIVHRDIKPDNILIDENGIAKLADFGLAKSMDANQQDTDLTAHGSAMGTPAYMSPEQCMGRHLDIRSDIYALGVTAYLALTGEKPFTGQSSFEIMTKHREHVPPAPGQLNPQLPQVVSDTIMQMLAKEPRDRCQTIADMHEQWTKIAENLGIRTGHRSGEWLAPDPFAMQPDSLPMPLDDGPYGPESA
ncbi:MAG: serine/threonine-protein kinase, partial [Planctomycetota bacterium]